MTAGFGLRRREQLPKQAVDLTVEGEEVLVISPRSPLGRALLGCEEGDEAEIKVEGQSLRYSLVSVS